MSGGSVKRLLREYKNCQSKPVREFTCYPLEDNMFEWHFTLLGPPDSPYSAGYYHGRILIPTNYPFAPPDVVLITPNGRFELEKRICLSISSYHPENWHPTWGITTVLHALREFMLTPGHNAVGAIDYPLDVKKKLAEDSVQFACKDCQQKISEHRDLMLASPHATEGDLAKDKELAVPTPDLKAKTPGTSGSPTVGSTGTPIEPPTPLSPLPPAAASEVSDEQAPGAKPATPSDEASTSSPSPMGREDSEKDTSTGTEPLAKPSADAEGKKESAEEEKKEIAAAAEAEPAAAAPPAGPAPVQEQAQEPPAAPAAPRPRLPPPKPGEIRVSVAVLDKILFYLMIVIFFILVKKAIFNWDVVGLVSSAVGVGAA